MKKILLFSLLFTFFISAAPADAAVFKLGRSLFGQVSGEKVTASTSSSKKPEVLKNCAENCDSCDRTTGTCSSCKTGYVLENNACSTCPANATCSGNDKILCDTGYELTSGYCSACTSSQYYSDYKCHDCPTGCLSCSSANSCDTCEADYSKVQGLCISDNIKCEYDNSSVGGYFWNSNGNKSIPAETRCWEGYGSYATISVPNGESYQKIRVRFWQNATVNGSFETDTLSSIYHTSGTVNTDTDDTIVKFSSRVTVNDTVKLQQSTVDPSKGVVMMFNGGLSGSPKCEVYTMDNQYGSNKVKSSDTCTCTTSECRIDPIGKCSVWDDNESDSIHWNSNGNKTIPSGLRCWDGYGADAVITVPSDANYDNANIRFWKNASVKGSFTTRELLSIYHTSGTVNTASSDTVVTFSNPVTVTETVTLQQSTSDPSKGVVFKFNGGLKGSPKCVVKTVKDQYANDEKTSSYTCSCTSSQCSIDPITPCSESNGGYFWNSNGNKTIPTDARCWRGYGANANITVLNNANYEYANVNFWNDATVNGDFSVGKLQSLYHSNPSSLDTTIRFKSAVTVNDKVELQQSKGDTSKGVTMIFEKGLRGSPSCVLYTMDDNYGRNMKVSTTKSCSCSTTQCRIN